jgi:hypothetical protein
MLDYDDISGIYHNSFLSIITDIHLKLSIGVALGFKSKILTFPFLSQIKQIFSYSSTIGRNWRSIFSKYA